MLSVIIPTHNKAPRLKLCLRTLFAATRQSAVPCEIIVVDDASSDNTTAVLDSARSANHSLCHVVRRDTQGGRSVARNAGAAMANGERLLFLDDDILISPTVLESHYSVQSKPELIVARATILNLPWLRDLTDPTRRCDRVPEGLAKRLIPADITDDSLIERVAPYARRSPFEADLHRLLAAHNGSAAGGRWLAATGGNLSVPREFFHQIGGFDEHMGLRWGVEDLEFGLRAECAGATIVHLHDVMVYHMDHKVSNREVDHQLALQYFSEKHGSNLGNRLAAYFAGNLDILSVV